MSLQSMKARLMWLDEQYVMMSKARIGSCCVKGAAEHNINCDVRNRSIWFVKTCDVLLPTDVESLRHTSLTNIVTVMQLDKSQLGSTNKTRNHQNRRTRKVSIRH